MTPPEEEYSEESEEQAVALYDFLYRDSNRIVSYYAQIFGGRITSQEETNLRRQSKDTSIKGDLKIVSTDAKSSRENQVISKQIVDPHDVLTSDVLTHLVRNRDINKDIENAPHGALVLVQGTVGFLEHSMTEMAIVTIKSIVLPQMKRAAKNAEGKAGVEATELAVKLLEKVRVPSAFTFKTTSGIQVVGTIKDEGMEEPIVTYYFKHGTGGLAEVYLIGIKETSTSAEVLPHTDFIGMGLSAAQGLTDFLFPPDSIRVTPIALFRAL